MGFIKDLFFPAPEKQIEQHKNAIAKLEAKLGKETDEKQKARLQNEIDSRNKKIQKLEGKAKAPEEPAPAEPVQPKV